MGNYNIDAMSLLVEVHWVPSIRITRVNVSFKLKVNSHFTRMNISYDLSEFFVLLTIKYPDSSTFSENIYSTIHWRKFILHE